MHSLSVPVVSPGQVRFFLQDASTHRQKLCILNPFSFEIHFRVDISNPDKFGISLNRGIINGQQKLSLELTCHTSLACNDSVQIRFYKWTRPRQGQRAPPQKYLGFRQVHIAVSGDGEEEGRGGREGSPGSEWGSASTSDSRHSSPARDDPEVSAQPAMTQEKKWQVISKVVLALALVVVGLLIDHFGEVTIVENIHSHSIAVACYTLAGILGLQLLTFR
ncbi:uncharacterized protein LOC101853730 [Aplysia californica]|uniref:Uncharacterized protein LOC101853730 n=1 Tax=Aplysia californica TaxID=6500 RepID=A0ABM0K3V1_APLCA|nr:uncharacterized protein LOC101853730 [Aplysia californica]